MRNLKITDFFDCARLTQMMKINNVKLKRVNQCKSVSCRQEAASQIALAATPAIRGNPTAECMDGNAHAVSLRNNVENQKIRFGSTARIRTL